ncbi:hypothetical protein QAD02_023495, partial [Eretmocerus hayati]
AAMTSVAPSDTTGEESAVSSNVEQAPPAAPPPPDPGNSSTSTPQQHPPPSPLSGCYLLVVLPELHSAQHKDLVLSRLAKGFLSWDKDSCHVDLEKELQALVAQAPEGEEARNGERLIQYATENLVTEVLIYPQSNTLLQCIRNLLASFTKHRHIIHAGYTFAGNGSWILQDGTFSLADFLDAFSEHEVQRVLRAYANSVTVDIHCAGVGDWSTARLSKEPCTRACRVRVNPDDVLTAGIPAITSFSQYLGQYLVAQTLDQLLEPSDIVGNIRFTHPTLYVFPGGQGDAALFGINGFNMLVDGGFARKACFWDFTRHLDRLDAVLFTRINNSNIGGMSSVLQKKKETHVYPQIGHFFCNLSERRQVNSPDGDKDVDPLVLDLIDVGQEMMVNLRHINLRPHPCYRDPEPINLYHKVGHGTLDMYILSPSKDSREVREFLMKWNASDSKVFAGLHRKDASSMIFPIQNLVSICAMLVWKPAHPEDTITRILFPGSTPQHKIFEGFDRLKKLEFLKHPVCSAKSITPSAATTLKDRPSGLKTKSNMYDRELKRLAEAKREKREIADDKPVKRDAIDETPVRVPSGKISAISHIKSDAKSKKKLENDKIDSEVKESQKSEGGSKESSDQLAKLEKSNRSEIGTKKTDTVKVETEKTAISKDPKSHKNETKKKEVINVTKQIIKSNKLESTNRSSSKLIDKKPKQTGEKKDIMKPSPTTPKKSMIGVTSKTETTKSNVKTIVKSTLKTSAAAPAKSAKEANNRMVVERKNIELASMTELANKPTETKTTKTKTVERKPITRSMKPSSPSKPRLPKSPAKSSKSTSLTSIKSEKDAVIRRVKKVSTAGSTALSSSPGAEMGTNLRSVDQTLTEKSEDMSLDSIECKVLADLREDQEVIEEIEAVLQKAERVEAHKEQTDGNEDPQICDKKGDEATEEDITAEMNDVPSKMPRKESHEFTEEDEYLIVEKEEIFTEDSMQSGDAEQKHHRDETETEKIKLVLEEDSQGNERLSEIAKECLEEKTDELPEKDMVESLEKFESGKTTEKEIVDKMSTIKAIGDEPLAAGEEDGKDTSREKDMDGKESQSTNLVIKVDSSVEKGLPEKLEGSQEKISTLESGATTAPTLPEDERIPMDEIKEVVDEKHNVEVSKEKDTLRQGEVFEMPVVQKPEIKDLDVQPPMHQTALRDVVKTPDEVADLPVHEEVDPKFYKSDETEKEKERERKTSIQNLDDKCILPEASGKEKGKGVLGFFGKVADKLEKGIDKLTKKTRRDSEKDGDDNSSKSGSPKEAKVEIVPTEGEIIKKEPESAIDDLIHASLQGRVEQSSKDPVTSESTKLFLESEVKDHTRTVKSELETELTEKTGDPTEIRDENLTVMGVIGDEETVPGTILNESHNIEDSLQHPTESLVNVAEATINAAESTDDMVKNTLSQASDLLIKAESKNNDSEPRGSERDQQMVPTARNVDEDDSNEIVRDFRGAVCDVAGVLVGTAGIKLERVHEYQQRETEGLREKNLEDDHDRESDLSKTVAMGPQSTDSTGYVETVTQPIPSSMLESSPEPDRHGAEDETMMDEPCIKVVKEKSTSLRSPVADPQKAFDEAKKICDDMIECIVVEKAEINTQLDKVDEVMESGLEKMCIKEVVVREVHKTESREDAETLVEQEIRFQQELSPNKAELVTVTPGSTPTSPKVTTDLSTPVTSTGATETVEQSLKVEDTVTQSDDTARDDEVKRSLTDTRKDQPLSTTQVQEESKHTVEAEVKGRIGEADPSEGISQDVSEEQSRDVSGSVETAMDEKYVLTAGGRISDDHSESGIGLEKRSSTLTDTHLPEPQKSGIISETANVKTTNAHEGSDIKTNNKDLSTDKIDNVCFGEDRLASGGGPMEPGKDLGSTKEIPLTGYNPGTSTIASDIQTENDQSVDNVQIKSECIQIPPDYHYENVPDERIIPDSAQDPKPVLSSNDHSSKQDTLEIQKVLDTVTHSVVSEDLAISESAQSVVGEEVISSIKREGLHTMGDVSELIHDLSHEETFSKIIQDEGISPEQIRVETSGEEGEKLVEVIHCEELRVDPGVIDAEVLKKGTSIVQEDSTASNVCEMSSAREMEKPSELELEVGSIVVEDASEGYLDKDDRMSIGKIDTSETTETQPKPGSDSSTKAHPTNLLSEKEFLGESNVTRAQETDPGKKLSEERPATDVPDTLLAKEQVQMSEAEGDSSAKYRGGETEHTSSRRISLQTDDACDGANEELSGTTAPAELVDSITSKTEKNVLSLQDEESHAAQDLTIDLITEDKTIHDYVDERIAHVDERNDEKPSIDESIVAQSDKKPDQSSLPLETSLFAIDKTMDEYSDHDVPEDICQRIDERVLGQDIVQHDLTFASNAEQISPSKPISSPQSDIHTCDGITITSQASKGQDEFHTIADDRKLPSAKDETPQQDAQSSERQLDVQRHDLETSKYDVNLLETVSIGPKIGEVSGEQEEKSISHQVKNVAPRSADDPVIHQSIVDRRKSSSAEQQEFSSNVEASPKETFTDTLNDQFQSHDAEGSSMEESMKSKGSEIMQSLKDDGKESFGGKKISALQESLEKSEILNLTDRESGPTIEAISYSPQNQLIREVSSTETSTDPVTDSDQMIDQSNSKTESCILAGTDDEISNQKTQMPSNMIDNVDRRSDTPEEIKDTKVVDGIAVSAHTAASSGSTKESSELEDSLVSCPHRESFTIPDEMTSEKISDFNENDFEQQKIVAGQVCTTGSGKETGSESNSDQNLQSNQSVSPEDSQPGHGTQLESSELQEHVNVVDDQITVTSVDTASPQQIEIVSQKDDTTSKSLAEEEKFSLVPMSEEPSTLESRNFVDHIRLTTLEDTNVNSSQDIPKSEEQLETEMAFEKPCPADDEQYSGLDHMADRSIKVSLSLEKESKHSVEDVVKTEGSAESALEEKVDDATLSKVHSADFEVTVQTIACEESYADIDGKDTSLKTSFARDFSGSESDRGTKEADTKDSCITTKPQSLVTDATIETKSVEEFSKSLQTLNDSQGISTDASSQPHITSLPTGGEAPNAESHTDSTEGGRLKISPSKILGAQTITISGESDTTIITQTSEKEWPSEKSEEKSTKEGETHVEVSIAQGHEPTVSPDTLQRAVDDPRTSTPDTKQIDEQTILSREVGDSVTLADNLPQKEDAQCLDTPSFVGSKDVDGGGLSKGSNTDVHDSPIVDESKRNFDDKSGIFIDREESAIDIDSKSIESKETKETETPEAIRISKEMDIIVQGRDGMETNKLEGNDLAEIESTDLVPKELKGEASSLFKLESTTDSADPIEMQNLESVGGQEVIRDVSRQTSVIEVIESKSPDHPSVIASESHSSDREYDVEEMQSRIATGSISGLPERVPEKVSEININQSDIPMRSEILLGSEGEEDPSKDLSVKISQKVSITSDVVKGEFKHATQSSPEHVFQGSPESARLNPHLDEEITISDSKRTEIEAMIMENYILRNIKFTKEIIDQISVKSSLPKYIILEIIEEISMKKGTSKESFFDEAIFEDDEAEDQLLALDTPSESKFEAQRIPESLLSSTTHTYNHPSEESVTYGEYESAFHKAFIGGMTEIRTTHITTLSGKTTPDLGIAEEAVEVVDKNKHDVRTEVPNVPVEFSHSDESALQNIEPASSHSQYQLDELTPGVSKRGPNDLSTVGGNVDGKTESETPLQSIGSVDIIENRIVTGERKFELGSTVTDSHSGEDITTHIEVHTTEAPVSIGVAQEISTTRHSFSNSPPKSPSDEAETTETPRRPQTDIDSRFDTAHRASIPTDESRHIQQSMSLKESETDHLLLGSIESPAPSIMRDLMSDDKSCSGKSSPDVSLPKEIAFGGSTGKSTPDMSMSPLIKDSSFYQSHFSGRSTPDKRIENKSRTSTPEGFRSGDVIRTIVTTTRTMSDDGEIITTTQEVTEATNEKGETIVLAEKTDIQVDNKISEDSITEVTSQGSSEHSQTADQIGKISTELSSSIGAKETGSLFESSNSHVQEPQTSFKVFSGETAEQVIHDTPLGDSDDYKRVTTESTEISSKQSQMTIEGFTVEREYAGSLAEKITKKYTDEADLDFEKVLTTEQGSSSTTMDDPTRGEPEIQPGHPSQPSDKKDPLAGWDSPLGLPSPRAPRKFYLRSPQPSSSADLSPDSLNFDLINDWGEPMRLPSPAASNEISNDLQPNTPEKEKKPSKKVLSENSKNKKNSDLQKKSEKRNTDSKCKVQPVYVDLTYVSHHGNSFYNALEFFKRVRARYYVFSGTEPSREVYDALLEAKKTWEDKDLEVTMIPTYDTDTLGYWVADNEEALAAHHIDLSPSASRCTINLQDHETSCSAYRLEF